MSNYISVRLSEIERLRRADDAHYVSIPRFGLIWAEMCSQNSSPCSSFTFGN